jgi:hypothetical protein
MESLTHLVAICKDYKWVLVMATLSQLVAAIATVEGIDEERVAALARAAREHGLIRTSGRGTSAAQMSEPDAANLLIATNAADTARTAPGVIKEYRALQAQRKNRTSGFGGELEAMISAAKRECLADYVKKTVAVLGSPSSLLGRRTFPTEAYEFGIEFEKPIPSVMVQISIAKGSPMESILFKDQRWLAKADGDRRERTRITQRTILAVADVLRT